MHNRDQILEYIPDSDNVYDIQKLEELLFLSENEFVFDFWLLNFIYRDNQYQSFRLAFFIVFLYWWIASCIQCYQILYTLLINWRTEKYPYYSFVVFDCVRDCVISCYHPKSTYITLYWADNSDTNNFRFSGIQTKKKKKLIR